MITGDGGYRRWPEFGGDGWILGEERKKYMILKDNILNERFVLKVVIKKWVIRIKSHISY